MGGNLLPKMHLDIWTPHFSVTFYAFGTVLLITSITEWNAKQTLQRSQYFGEEESICSVCNVTLRGKSADSMRFFVIFCILVIFVGLCMVVYFENSVVQQNECYLAAGISLTFNLNFKYLSN